jgi:hypothetical protein
MTTEANLEPIGEADVRRFMQTLSTWARDLPRHEQALLHLMLATAAAAENPDVSEYLAGFAIPNPDDVVVVATGTARGAQTGEVVGPSAGVIAGDVTGDAAQAAAGSALARALLNNWGEPRGGSIPG